MVPRQTLENATAKVAKNNKRSYPEQLPIHFAELHALTDCLGFGS